MEATIEFIENIGEKFEALDENKGEGKSAKTMQDIVPEENFTAAVKIIERFLGCPEIKVDENGDYELQELDDLSADHYFKILILLDNQILSQKSSRLSALFKNLEERRDNNWQKHHAEADGPKKLKDIKDDIAREENEITSKVEVKTKKEIDVLNEDMQKMLEMFQNDDKNWERLFKNDILPHSNEDIITSYLKLVAEEKKVNVVKRLDFFPNILEKCFRSEDFRVVWPKVIQALSLLSSDLPFVGAALAKILDMIDAKRGLRVKEYYHKFEDEDEEWFMNEVFEKFYHTTTKPEFKDYIKEVVEVSEKPPSGML